MLPEPVRRVPLLRAATTGRLLPEPELPVREQRRALRPGPTEPLPGLLRVQEPPEGPERAQEPEPVREPLPGRQGPETRPEEPEG